MVKETVSEFKSVLFPIGVAALIATHAHYKSDRITERVAAFGDFNGDDTIDLVILKHVDGTREHPEYTLNYHSSRLFVAYSRGDGSFEQRKEIASYSGVITNVFALDLNNDALPDLKFHLNNREMVTTNNKQSGFQSPTPTTYK